MASIARTSLLRTAFAFLCLQFFVHKFLDEGTSPKNNYECEIFLKFVMENCHSQVLSSTNITNTLKRLIAGGFGIGEGWNSSQDLIDGCLFKRERVGICLRTKFIY